MRINLTKMRTTLTAFLSDSLKINFLNLIFLPYKYQFMILQIFINWNFKLDKIKKDKFYE
ncbi:hypothetical protein D6B99_16515 [Arachidicoccus soli]|uniref:Uncharacterized protein n=1 Tax=Arachidicoccus soli TaxID=2341117 RepID=A0A386HUF6_9BACT|nr:hypothetical protein D6B99_16515 [Arachidicoccus soli]